MINLFFEEIEPFELNPDIYKDWLSVVCVEEQKELNEVNLIFCSDDYLLNMNIEFLPQHSPLHNLHDHHQQQSHHIPSA